MLAETHSHLRDIFILFEPKNHTYTFIPTGKKLKSVTTLIHNFFSEFDADKIIDKMMNSYKWPDSQYYGMTKELIKEKWERNAEEARRLGTQMHADIENYFNDNLKEIPNTPEFSMFLRFWEIFKQTNPTFHPYRTEWKVYDNSISGTIDFVMENEKGELVILDWKRSKEIKYNNDFQKGLEPISHLDDCNFNHYSLQLNAYRYILETKYDKKVLGMFLVVCHPDFKEAQLINVERNEKDIVSIWKSFC